MGTLFDYIEWRGDIQFSTIGVGEIDNLIFSQICYIDFKRIVPASFTARPVSFLAAAKKYMQAHKGETVNLGAIMPAEVVALTAKAARSARFSATSMIGYVNRVSAVDQTQFSAVTFLIGEDTCFVAFRGTDDTIVGWKESFSMSFMCPIPAQRESVKYLNGIADAFPNRKIYVGGHSKGGNLAVYSSVKCREDVNRRIVAVYNNDGPGFDREFLESEEYISTRDRICTIVPQSSVVGMMLEHEENYEVVQSSMNGLLQHNAFFWNVSGNKFVRNGAVTEQSKRIDRTLKDWMNEMPVEQRKKTIDSMYEILSAANVKTLSDLNADKLKLLKAWSSLDADSKKVIKRLVSITTKKAKK